MCEGVCVCVRARARVRVRVRVCTCINYKALLEGVVCRGYPAVDLSFIFIIIRLSRRVLSAGGIQP
jgi:hypothetical protein